MTGGSKADGPLLEPVCYVCGGKPDMELELREYDGTLTLKGHTCKSCIGWPSEAEARQLAFDRAERLKELAAEAQAMGEYGTLHGDDR